MGLFDAFQEEIYGVIRAGMPNITVIPRVNQSAQFNWLTRLIDGDIVPPWGALATERTASQDWSIDSIDITLDCSIYVIEARKASDKIADKLEEYCSDIHEQLITNTHESFMVFPDNPPEVNVALGNRANDFLVNGNHPFVAGEVRFVAYLGAIYV